MTWEDFSGLLKDADAVVFLAGFIWLLIFAKKIRLDREYTALERERDEQVGILKSRLARRDEERERLTRAHEDELRRTREDYERRLVAVESEKEEFKAMALNALRLGERATKVAEREATP